MSRRVTLVCDQCTGMIEWPDGSPYPADWCELQIIFDKLQVERADVCPRCRTHVTMFLKRMGGEK